MKKLIPVFLLIAVCCSANSLPLEKQLPFFMQQPPAGGSGGFTYTIISHGDGNASAGNTATVTLNTTGANLYVVNVSWLDGTVNLSDDAGGGAGSTYTARNQYVDSVGGWRKQMFDVVTPATGATVTFTVFITSGSGYPTISVIAAKKSSGTPAFDVQSGLDGAGANTGTRTIASATPAGNNELGISAMILGGSNNSQTPSSITAGYTITDSRTTVGMAYVIQTTATASAPVWTWTGADTICAGAQAFYK